MYTAVDLRTCIDQANRRDEISDKRSCASGIQSARRLENSRALFNIDMSAYIGYRVLFACVSRLPTKPADQMPGSKPTAFHSQSSSYISSQRSDAVAKQTQSYAIISAMLFGTRKRSSYLV